MVKQFWNTSVKINLSISNFIWGFIHLISFKVIHLFNVLNVFNEDTEKYLFKQVRVSVGKHSFMKVFGSSPNYLLSNHQWMVAFLILTLKIILFVHLLFEFNYDTIFKRIRGL